MLHINDRIGRSARQLALLRHAPERRQRFDHFGFRRLARELDRHGDQVTVHNRNTIAVRADLGFEGAEAVGHDLAQDLLSLPLHLLFFAADEGDDIRVDVHGRDARISGARDGLHRCGDHACDAEFA